MKKLILALGFALLVPALHASDGPAATSPSEPASGAEPTSALSMDDLFESWTSPEPQNLHTFITWAGGVCTAWLYCPGEPYWKCQSTSGDCQHTGCAITCNGNTRRCKNPCIEF